MPVETTPKYQGTVLQVAVPSPLRRVFDYLPLAEKQALPGTRVKVSFGRQQLIGIVVSVSSGSSLEKKKLKRSEEHTSELQSLAYLVCRLLLEKKKQ